MKEIQILAELLNIANKAGAFDINQAGIGITALNNITKTLHEHGIISAEDEEAGPVEASEPSQKEA